MVVRTFGNRLLRSMGRRLLGARMSRVCHADSRYGFHTGCQRRAIVQPSHLTSPSTICVVGLRLTARATAVEELQRHVAQQRRQFTGVRQG